MEYKYAATKRVARCSCDFCKEIEEENERKAAAAASTPDFLLPSEPPPPPPGTPIDKNRKSEKPTSHMDFMYCAYGRTCSIM